MSAIPIGELVAVLTLKDMLSPVIKSAGAEIDKFAGGYSKYVKGVAAGAGAVVGAISGITAAIIMLGDRGAGIADLEQQFDVLNRTIGNSPDTLQRVAGAMAGVVSNAEIMRSTNQAMSLGLKATTADLELVGKGARVLADRVGGDVGEAYAKITMAMATGQDRQLKFIGLNIDAAASVEKYAASLGKTTGQLNENQQIEAKRAAILDAVRTALQQSGEAQTDFSDRLAQVKVASENMMDSLSKAIANSPALAVVMDKISSSIQRAFGPGSQDGITKIARAVNEFAIFMVQVANGVVQGAGYIGQAWYGLVAIFNAVGAGIMNIAGVILTGFARVYGTIGDITSKMSEMFSKVASLPPALATAMGINVEGAKQLKGAFEDIGAAAHEAERNATDMAKGSENWASGFDKNATQALQSMDAVKGVADSASGWLDGLEGDMRAAAAAMGDLDGAAQGLGSGMGTGAGGIKDLSEEVQTLLNHLKGKDINKQVDDIRQALAALGNSKGNLTALKELETQLKGLEKAGAKGAADALKEVAAAINTANDGVVTLSNKAFPGLEQALREAQAAAGALNKELNFFSQDEATKQVEEQINQMRYEEQRTGAIQAAAKAMLQAGKISQEEYDKITGKTEAAAAATVSWADAVQGLTALMDALGISGDSALGKIMGSIGGASAAFQNLQKLGAGKDGKGFSLGNIFKGGEGGKLGFGSILSGITGVLGAASAAFSVGKAIFGLFHKSPAQKAAKEAGKFIGENVSKEMGEQIAKKAKELGVSIKAATMLSLPELMAQSSKAATAFAPQMIDLMAAIKSGTVPAAEGMKALDESFSKLAEEASKAKFASLEMFQVMDAARKSGQLTESMKASIKQAVEAMATAMGGTGGLKLVSEESARASASVFALVWSQTVAEKGLVGAAAALKDAFEDLQARLEESGFSEAAAGIFAPIQQQFALANDEMFAGAADAATSYADVLKNAVNTAMPLTIEQFQSFQQLGQDAFNQAKQAAIEQGLTVEQANSQALLAVAPLLQQLVQAAAAYGFELDAGTQALIDQAKAQGIAFATSPIDRAANAIERLVTVLEKALGVTGDLAGEFNNLGNAIPDGNLSVGHGNPRMPGDLPGFAGGTGGQFLNFGAGTPVMLHGKERVMTEGEASAPVSIAPTFNVTINGGGNLDPEAVAKALHVAVRDDLQGIGSRLQGK